jgi:hypothetical protein
MKHPKTNTQLSDFRDMMETEANLLLAINPLRTAQRPAPEKWSPKEIIGHLIDSAANNHQRFVRLQLENDADLSCYDQEKWVSIHGYQEAPWDELVTLWRGYNKHIARIMISTPDNVLARDLGREKLKAILWCPLPQEFSGTLEYLMLDYIGHLEHHLKQVRTLLQ